MTLCTRVAIACVFFAGATSASLGLDGIPHELESPAGGAHAHTHGSLLRGSARRALSVYGVDESGINCDFDLSFCNFTGSWSRTNGYTPTGNSKTGPKADNTVGDAGGLGYYAYAEANGNANTAVSMFINLEHDFTGLGVHFYYHMFGVQIGTLALAVSSATNKGGTTSDDGEWEDVWSLTGNQLANNQAQFEYAYVMFDSNVTGVRRFRFTSTPYGNAGDAAIDDFKVIALPTPVPSPSPTPEPSSLPTLLPSVSKLPSISPTPLPTQVPTKPTTKPTRLPTQVPSPRPSPLPTILPSISTLPSPVPTPLPSALPTLPPTVLFRVDSNVLAANLTLALYAFLGLLLFVAMMAWLAVWRNESIKAGQRREAIRVAERKKLRKQKRAKMLAKKSGGDGGGNSSGLAGSYLADRYEPSSSGTEDDFADLSSDSDKDADKEDQMDDYEKWARRKELAAMRAETALGAGSRRTTKRLLKENKARRAYVAAAARAQAMAAAVAERSASASRSLGRSIERAVSIGRDSSAGRAMTASIERITRSFSGSGSFMLGNSANASGQQNEADKDLGQSPSKAMHSRVLSHRVRKDLHALRSCLDAADLGYLGDTLFGAGITTPRQVANLDPESPAPGLLGLTNQEQVSLRELIGAARSLGVHTQDSAFNASALRRAVMHARASSQVSNAQSPFPGMDEATMVPFSSVAATAVLAVESLGVGTGLDATKRPARERGANGRYQMHPQVRSPVDENDAGVPVLAEPKSEAKSAGHSSKKSAPKASAKASSSKAQPPRLEAPPGGAGAAAVAAEKRTATTGWGEDTKEGHNEDMAAPNFADSGGLSGSLSSGLGFANKMPMNLDGVFMNSLWGGKSIAASQRSAQPPKGDKDKEPRQAEVSPSKKASKKRDDAKEGKSTKVDAKSKAKAKKAAAAAAAAKIAAEAKAAAEAEEAVAASTGMSGWGVPQRGELTGRLTPFPDRWAGQGPKSPTQAAAFMVPQRAASPVNPSNERHAVTPALSTKASSHPPVLTRRERADAAAAEAAAAVRAHADALRAQTLAANEANMARRVGLAQQHPGRRPSVMTNMTLVPSSPESPSHHVSQPQRTSQSSPDQQHLSKRLARQDDKKGRSESATLQEKTKKKAVGPAAASQPAAQQNSGDIASWLGGAGFPGFTL